MQSFFSEIGLSECVCFTKYETFIKLLFQCYINRTQAAYLNSFFIWVRLGFLWTKLNKQRTVHKSELSSSILYYFFVQVFVHECSSFY